MKSIGVIFVLLLAAATACTASKHKTVITGADRDSHGCIPSAGYQWSEARNECIRLFEAGTPLFSLTDSMSSFAAYVVFNFDRTLAELFLPESPEAKPLLKQASPTSWQSAQYTLTQTNDTTYTLTKSAMPIYKSR